MTLADHPKVRRRQGEWPEGLREALAASAAVPAVQVERRRVPRTRYEVEGRLVVEAPDVWAGPIEIYTRDVNPWAVRFVSETVLPLATRASLHVLAPKGDDLLQIDCVIRRCREIVPGWFDVVARFTLKQTAFGEYNMPQAA